MQIFYKIFRKTKTFLIDHKVPVLTYVFFALLPFLEKLFSARKENWRDSLKRNIAQQIYFNKYSRTNPPFVLVTDYPLAVDSHDHQWPRGTLYDNSCNKLFNVKLYDLLGYKSDLKVLDIGCSGGAFVRSILQDGFYAIGLEGSDVSKKLQTGEWGTIPLHLFTCDITKPFSLKNAGGLRLYFDAITAWDVLEHIPRDLVPALITNIRSNLRDGGYFIASVSTVPDANPNVNANYHVTIENHEWWFDKFQSQGFREMVKHEFTRRDWLRGTGKGMDWNSSDGSGFHMVLQKK